MKKLNLPKAKFQSDPFVNGFTDIDSNNSDFTIGTSDKFENIFKGEIDNPEYLKILCKISGKSEFQDVIISAKYKIEEDDSQEKTMTYSIYDGVSLDKQNMVSEINIHALEITNEFENISNIMKEYMESNPIIYTKKFKVQNASKEIENFIDNSLDQSDIIHTRTKAHFFAGLFNKSFKISDIQQNLFFMGTSYQAAEYIKLISAKDLVGAKNTIPNVDVTLESLSTLEDDITNGKIEINFEGNLKYKSITSNKTTLTSDIFQILFKKEK